MSKSGLAQVNYHGDGTSTAIELDASGVYSIPGISVVAFDTVRPYWQNPRTITEQAVGAVRQSIERYGYRQPIVVDTDNVIITGHTRYAALRKLGATHVSVLVAADLAPELAREYRVMDNRVAEFTSWDNDALVAELRAFERELVDIYFPEVDLGMSTLEQGPTQAEINIAAEAVVDLGTAKVMQGQQVTCPACYHEFMIKGSS